MIYKWSFFYTKENLQNLIKLTFLNSVYLENKDQKWLHVNGENLLFLQRIISKSFLDLVVFKKDEEVT